MPPPVTPSRSATISSSGVPSQAARECHASGHLSGGRLAEKRWAETIGDRPRSVKSSNRAAPSGGVSRAFVRLVLTVAPLTPRWRSRGLTCRASRPRGNVERLRSTGLERAKTMIYSSVRNIIARPLPFRRAGEARTAPKRSAVDCFKRLIGSDLSRARGPISKAFRGATRVGGATNRRGKNISRDGLGIGVFRPFHASKRPIQGGG